MASVFISYSTLDSYDAMHVYRLLCTHGIEAWIAPHGEIQGGDEFAFNIADALDDCDTVVFIVSDSSQESLWVSREIAYATMHDKRIIPYVIEYCTIEEGFSFINYSDLTIYAYDISDADASLIKAVQLQQ